MMKRLLSVTLLSLLSGAQAAYCYDNPLSQDSLFQFLRGAPKQVNQRFLVSGAKDNTVVQAALQKGRLSELVYLTAYPDKDRFFNLLAFFPVSATQSRGWVGFADSGPVSLPLAGEMAQARANAQEKKGPTAVSLAFDSQGRLSSYSGLLIVDGLLAARQLSVTCAYSQRGVVETMNMPGAHRTVATVQFGDKKEIRSIESTVQMYDGPVDFETFQPALGKTVKTQLTQFVYRASGQLTAARVGIPIQRDSAGRLIESGPPESEVKVSLDSRGNVVRLDSEAGAEVRVAEFSYDAKGNWVKRVTRSAGKTVTTTRTITY
ncbi:hypothetical protein K7W42_07500 [Deinococcus sp. HMF7604]|uniref:hypothetical protein n=1 Tax=Deinococcus betulae TaxID=2873312 RepID=UPI001CCEC45A|nr:hypothetical protein [Deinococcus betulae]MBZ9750706.1 hypothetical protein [Deinococcus betulae]